MTAPDPHLPAVATVERRAAGAEETARANRRWWDAAEPEYYSEHGDFLGDDRFVWCPERLDEQDARLLGDVSGRRVLEVGAGAAQCARWLLAHGAEVVASDLSMGMLRRGAQIDAALAANRSRRVPLVQADAQHLPFADAAFDLACSAYGAVPFVADSAAVMAEIARVLRPGGRWVFSVSHPIRWALPDDLVEPEWPAGHAGVWGGWSPTRGRLIPGTAIFCCRKPS